MKQTTVCTVCDEPGTIADTSDVLRIASDVRKFRHRTFTVWRCRNCRSLHSKERVNLDRFYKDYPVRRQRLDFFTRVVLRNRLRLLLKGGLKPGKRVLDYGCGSGMFVRYLRDAGYDVAGYDPYSPEFSDRTVLSQRFDVLLCQDVIEHVTDPLEMLQEWFTLLKEGGLLFVGTPDACAIDLTGTARYAMEIHQPYHRHIFSQRALVGACARIGLRFLRCTSRFYADTWVPFLNMAFLRAYVEKTGGCVDIVFEPPALSTVLSSPRLLLLAGLGRFVDSPGNLLYVFQKPQG